MSTRTKTPRGPVSVTRSGEAINTRTMDFDSFKEAAKFTAMGLVDNGYATKRVAQEWQATLQDLGSHTFGNVTYVFHTPEQAQP